MNNIRTFLVCSSSLLMSWLFLSYSIKLENNAQRTGADTPQAILSTPAATGESNPGIPVPAGAQADELSDTAALADIK